MNDAFLFKRPKGPVKCDPVDMLQPVFDFLGREGYIHLLEKLEHLDADGCFAQSRFAKRGYYIFFQNSFI
jgi:hypothetical protein